MVCVVEEGRSEQNKKPVDSTAGDRAEKQSENRGLEWEQPFVSRSIGLFWSPAWGGSISRRWNWDLKCPMPSFVRLGDSSLRP